MRALLATAILCGASLLVAQSTDTKSVLKVYVATMPNNLDQFLRAEFSRQMKGRIAFVPGDKDADATITSLNMVNKDHKVLLWSDDAGDKMILYRVDSGTERKVAEHLVSKLKKEIDKEGILRK